MRVFTVMMVTLSDYYCVILHPWILGIDVEAKRFSSFDTKKDNFPAFQSEGEFRVVFPLCVINISGPKCSLFSRQMYTDDD